MSFIFKIYLSRQISTTQLGIYTIAISICGVFLTLLSTGLPLVISRKTAETIVDNNKDKSYKIVSSGLFISIILSIIVVAVFLLLKPLILLIYNDNQLYLVLLTLLPMLIGCAIYAPIKGYLWGHEKYYDVSLVEFVEQVLRIIICVILFSFISNRNLPAGIAYSIACFFSTCLGFFIYFKKGGKIKSPNEQLSPVFKSSAPLTTIRVVGSLLAPLISIVLPIQLVNAGYTSSQALSKLGIVMGMTFPLTTIPTTLVGSLSMALIPKLTVLQKENNQKNLEKQVNTALIFTLFSCFMFVPIFYALGEPICNFLFNNSEAGIYLHSFCWIILPMGLGQISTSMLNSLGKEKKVFINYFISSFSILFSLFVLPKYIGINALMWGLGIQNTIVCLLNFKDINKQIKVFNNFIKIFTKFLVVSIIVSLTSHWLFSLILQILPSFICLVIIGIFAAISFITLCFCFNIFNFGFFFQFKNKKV